MTLMIADLYDALREAGASEDKAKKAASEVAGYDNRLAGLESEVKLLRWMSTFQIAMLVTILFKLFT